MIGMDTATKGMLSITAERRPETQQTSRAAKIRVPRSPSPSPSLPALTAILNSSRAQRWFESHAKHRGAHLDISGTILKQFPLPMRCQPDLERALTQLTQSWPKVPDSGFESQLDQIVDSWYSVAE